MATIKFANEAGKYADANALETVIAYILQTHKTPSRIVGGYGVDPQTAAESMHAVSQHFRKDYGIRLRHFILSFYPQETPQIHMAQKIAAQICSYIGKRYQIVYALHEDTAMLHLHFVFNSVSYVDGFKYHGSKEDYYTLLNFIWGVLLPYGITKLISVK